MIPWPPSPGSPWLFPGQPSLSWLFPVAPIPPHCYMTPSHWLFPRTRFLWLFPGPPSLPLLSVPRTPLPRIFPRPPSPGSPCLFPGPPSHPWLFPWPPPSPGCSQDRPPSPGCSTHPMSPFSFISVFIWGQDSHNIGFFSLAVILELPYQNDASSLSSSTLLLSSVGTPDLR